MALMATAVSVAASIVFTPFLMFILCIIFLASIGKSLGVRRLYVNILLKIFEYGRQHIEVADRVRRPDEDADDDDDDEEEQDTLGGAAEHSGRPRAGARPRGAGDAERAPSASLANGNAVGANGHSISMVIKREDLILAPDPGLNYKRTGSQERLSSPSCAETSNSSSALVPNGTVLQPSGGSCPDILGRENGIQHTLLITPATPTQTEVASQAVVDFDLSSCLEYVKAGMEAIIEDQVTSVFEAEELRSWNLLTRTNRHYEFVSWRLTVIWMMGFFVRYFFLLPLRILICFIGVTYFLVSMPLIGLIPDCAVQRFLGDLSFKIGFRLLSRCLSCVLTFHNLRYKPLGGGFCVANHTSPIDVVMLSSETCFSLVWWLTLCTAAVGYIEDGAFKRRANRIVSIMCFETLSRSLSSVITYHNAENRPRRGLCVANHTSPIDVLVLMCDNCYSLIGQRHGGFLGLLQRALARASPHIWFERSEAKDRNAVAKRLKQHVSDPNNPPILIFPEGTCINNTSVMQFKKGSFEVGGVIYPVAIKYDARFGDAFWNSSRHGMLHYLYMMMSSWAIVCDVWYLPPMYRQPYESAIDFANRVKSVIARQGGLVDLMWDGQLKRMKPKKEWKELQQEEFTRRLKGE